LNQEGKIVRFNDYSAEIFGMPTNEIVGRSTTDFVHESDQEKVPKEIRGALEEGYREFEMTLKTTGGNTAIYRFNAERLKQDGQTYIIGTGIEGTGIYRSAGRSVSNGRILFRVWRRHRN